LKPFWRQAKTNEAWMVGSDEPGYFAKTGFKFNF